MLWNGVWSGCGVGEAMECGQAVEWSVVKAVECDQAVE